LKIQTFEQLNSHYLKGNIFENFVICELLKMRFNYGMLSNLYFWRDNHGHEVDCVIEQANRLIALEVKAGKTINQNYFSALNYWKSISNIQDDNYLIYAGDSSQKRTGAQILSWRDINQLEDVII
ncbi:MAG: DUF4143 domain-containing protein, partial [Gammaproteobacteria bacterium]